MVKLNFSNVPEMSYSLKESLRGIRTNIMFSGKENKVILITSTSPEEGKSTVSLNIAMSFAQENKKVLYIDSDIRKSAFISRYGIKNEGEGKIKGLTHLLSGQNGLQEVLCHTNLYPTLAVICSGPDSSNATELLANDRFHKLIESARAYYDYVIIDTAPLSATVDASLIAKECDGAIMVIEPEKDNVRLINRCKAQLENSGIRILGVVLNKFKTKRNSYYGKYYGSYYGREDK